jgi:hypothetical protein
MMSSKGKRYKPEDLFTFDDEVKEQAPKIDIKSKEAEEMFKKMEEKYLKKWQSR